MNILENLYEIYFLLESIIVDSDSSIIYYNIKF